LAMMPRQKARATLARLSAIAALVAVVAFVAFVFLTFPFDELARSLEAQVRGSGGELTIGRMRAGLGGVTAFWQRHRLGRDIDLVGLETATSVPPMPLVKTPALQLTAGVAHVRLTRTTRGTVGVRWKP